MGLVLRARSRMCTTHSHVCQCDTGAGRSDTWRGYTITLPQRLHNGEGAPAQQRNGEHRGLFMGFNPWCQLLKLDDFHLHFSLLCQGSHALNWKETTTAAPITAPIRTCHPVPQEDVMANVPYMCCSTQGTSTQCPTMSWPLRWPSFSQHRTPFLSKEPWPRLESSPFKPT